MTILTAMAAVAGTTVLILGTSPEVAADGPAPASIDGKGDRLDMRPIGRECSARAWPYFEVECLRDVRGMAGRARAVRLVTPDQIALADRQ